MTDTTPVHGDAPTVVGVALSDCTPQDADTVLRVLSTAFPSDRTPTERPEGDATVWLTTVDAASRPAPREAGPLSGTVTADIQGGHEALDRVRAALASAFTVTEETAASGDQEQEFHLRLTTRH
ncbi:hypothetical protein [Streptomyces endophyticus]|uniref:Uncharacterized protein n=1 Tax=Streptomyces endophyticus TaxID=714166 RepID=A0ABU6EYM8_9ACTN|nr:hypothetical protein [Streptomyces endophyticus]MEB8336830.1 hypothetical protein [Streptomyces endophyticus]